MKILNRDFKVVIIRKNVKNVNVKISPKQEVIITAHKMFSEKELYLLLEKNHLLLEKLVQKVTFFDINDNQIMLFGKLFTLYEKPMLTIDYFIEKDVIYYRHKKTIYDDAQSKIIDMFNEFVNKYDFPTNIVLTFRKMKTRWGVCYYKKGQICLTSHLIHIPSWLIYYVICHELCHFKYPNHSKDFYSEISLYFPEYKKAIKEIKKYSYFLK